MKLNKYRKSLTKAQFEKLEKMVYDDENSSTIVTIRRMDSFPNVVHLARSWNEEGIIGKDEAIINEKGEVKFVYNWS